jgi:hypothetical protein
MRRNTQTNVNSTSNNAGGSRSDSSSRRSRLVTTLGAVSADSGNSRGMFDAAMKPFAVSKYGQERHARSLDPNNFLRGYSFVGPGTELHLRDQLKDSTPLNSLDRTAKAHDYAYGKEAQEYSIDRNKNKHMQNIWKADSSFIASTFLNRDDPIMGTIAAGMIGMKMLGEKTGLLDTKRFSGIQDQPGQQSDNGGLGRGRQRIAPLVSSPTKAKGGASLRNKKDEFLWDNY